MMTQETQVWKHSGAGQLKSMTEAAQDELMREHLKKLQVAWKRPRRNRKREAA